MVIYGAETLTLNKDIVKWLATFERKVLRRMFGGIKLNENWRKRYDKELKAAVWRFKYSFICQNKSVELHWSY